jgi:hypothetical protein
MLHRRTLRGETKGAGLSQPKPEKRAKKQGCGEEKMVGEIGRRSLEAHSKECDGEDSDIMGSFEIKQKQEQQLQRLRKKAPAPAAECYRNSKEFLLCSMCLFIADYCSCGPQGQQATTSTGPLEEPRRAHALLSGSMNVQDVEFQFEAPRQRLLGWRGD